MDKQTTEKVIKFIKNKTSENNRKAIDLILYGGEPLLNPDTCFAILDSLYSWCKENKIKFLPGLITNGTLLTKELIDKFSKYDMDYIQIVLDGTKKKHDATRTYNNGNGTFEKSLSAAKALHGSKIPLRIQINMDEYADADDVNKLLDDLNKRGLGGITVSLRVTDWIKRYACPNYAFFCLPGGIWGEPAAYVQEDAIKKGFDAIIGIKSLPVFCEAETKFSYVIDPQGNLYKCITFLGRNEHCIGSIDNEGKLPEIHYCYYDLMSRDPIEMESCKNCSILPACAGGCCSYAYEQHGTYHAPVHVEGTDNCKIIKDTLEDKIEVILRLEGYEKIYREYTYDQKKSGQVF